MRSMVEGAVRALAKTSRELRRKMSSPEVVLSARLAVEVDGFAHDAAARVHIRAGDVLQDEGLEAVLLGIERAAARPLRRASLASSPAQRGRNRNPTRVIPEKPSWRARGTGREDPKGRPQHARRTSVQLSAHTFCPTSSPRKAKLNFRTCGPARSRFGGVEGGFVGSIGIPHPQSVEASPMQTSGKAPLTARPASAAWRSRSRRNM